MVESDTSDSARERTQRRAVAKVLQTDDPIVYSVRQVSTLTRLSWMRHNGSEMPHLAERRWS
jgi:hypothetical protein